MVKPKHTDNVDMTFTAEEPKTEPVTSPVETFEKEGHIIYKVDESGLTVFYDIDGNAVSNTVIENLSLGYPVVPETNDNGDEKDGELKVRFIKQETQEGIVKSSEVEFKDCDIIEERQYYKNGEAFIKTIPKKYYYIIKYLRGEYE